MSRAFVAGITAPGPGPQPAWWFIFRGNQLLIQTADDQIAVPRTPPASAPVRQLYLGTLAGEPCHAAEIAAETAIPPGMELFGLRDLYGRLDDDLYALAGRASQLIEWDRTHQFCGRCGTPTVSSSKERAKVCPNCGYLAFPRVSPAVIILIHRGSELLLARGHQFTSGMYGLIAGFVEAGETLEAAVEREIAEEIGISVTDIRYFGSQPWPFPHQLMVGFTAIYASGEIRPLPAEIADARWFAWNDLPLIPAKNSIARRLIDAFVARQTDSAK